MITVPISDIIPLALWVQAYHAFRVRLDLALLRTGLDLLALHEDRLGPPVQAGVWETDTYRVYVQGNALTFEVPEGCSILDATEAFNTYQEKLFKPLN